MECVHCSRVTYKNLTIPVTSLVIRIVIIIAIGSHIIIGCDALRAAIMAVKIYNYYYVVDDINQSVM